MNITSNRVLIELDSEIDSGYGGQYERFVDKFFNGDKRLFDNFFDVQITNANNRRKDIIKALHKSNQFWVDSCFIGDSGRLLVEMLKYCIENKLTGKTLVNMRKWENVMWHLPDEARNLITLVNERSISFIYADDEEYFDLLPNKK